MKKDVIITFKGINYYEDEPDEKVEFLTSGSFFAKGDKYYLQYEEMTEEEPEKTNTTLKIEKDKVTIIRYGRNNTQLTVERGKKHLCLYDTPYGAVTIGIVPDDVVVNIGDRKGEIKLNYGIEYNNVLTGKNKLNLTFEEVTDYGKSV